MTHIPDDFDSDRFWGYVRGNAGLPGAPIYTPVRKPPRAEPRKFDPQYRKAGEPAKQKTRHFNQETFWRAVSWTGMTGGILIVLLTLIYISYLTERAS